MTLRLRERTVTALVEKYFPVVPDCDFDEKLLLRHFGPKAATFIAFDNYCFDVDCRWVIWSSRIDKGGVRFKTEADAVFAKFLAGS